MTEYKRVHLAVTGSVQGVGFRFFAVHLARRLNVTGWVRNRGDGAVEAVAEGEAGMVREFVEGIRRGPVSADVRGLEVTPEPFRGEFDCFEVTY